jgi:hypothetical protein
MRKGEKIPEEFMSKVSKQEAVYAAHNIYRA